jgi:hypothetical protein
VCGQENEKESSSCRHKGQGQAQSNALEDSSRDSGQEIGKADGCFLAENSTHEKAGSSN